MAFERSRIMPVDMQRQCDSSLNNQTLICRNCAWFNAAHGCCYALSPRRGQREPEISCKHWTAVKPSKKNATA